jgi:hypothetical protein
LARLIVGRRKNMRIEVLFLLFLGVLKFRTKLSMDLVKTSCKIISSRNGRDVSKLGGKGRVIGIVGEEGSLLCQRMFCIIKNKFSKRKVINPVILLVRAVRAQVALKSLVGMLCEAVGMRMISCRKMCIDVETLG